MTILEFCNDNVKALHARLEADRARLSAAIQQAAGEGRMSDVDDLRPQLDDVNDDLAFLDARKLDQLCAANLPLPSLPADFAEILKRGDADVVAWTRLQSSIQKAIDVAGGVADGVSTAAQLLLKYGKFLL